jgi:hypothetical protein
MTVVTSNRDVFLLSRNGEIIRDKASLRYTT